METKKILKSLLKKLNNSRLELDNKFKKGFRPSLNEAINLKVELLEQVNVITHYIDILKGINIIQEND